jgi:hypothetical protein
MNRVTYKVVKHDSGWTYEANARHSETFRTREEARTAAKLAASETRWHNKVGSGADRPNSGIVLHIESPYRVGDWIIVDDNFQGQIVETDWRATHILTGNQDIAIIPNSVIAISIRHYNYRDILPGVVASKIKCIPSSARAVARVKYAAVMAHSIRDVDGSAS